MADGAGHCYGRSSHRTARECHSSIFISCCRDNQLQADAAGSLVAGKLGRYQCPTRQVSCKDITIGRSLPYHCFIAALSLQTGVRVHSQLREAAVPEQRILGGMFHADSSHHRWCRLQRSSGDHEGRIVKFHRCCIQMKIILFPRRARRRLIHCQR